MTKPRALILSTNPPRNAMGGSLLFYRQFIERDDYEVAVITDLYVEPETEIPWLRVHHPVWLRRLMNSRLSLWAHDYIHLYAGKFLPQTVLEFARDFSPDIIIVGAETWIGDLGITLGKKLGIPVAGYFMDWPTYASLAHPWIKKYLSTVFRKRYSRCQIAFGICPEMLDALGPHPNAHVYYPSGPPLEDRPSASSRGTDKRFTLFFGGNLGQWYGEAVTSLLNELDGNRNVSFCVAGTNAPWSDEEEKRFKSKGVYLGFLDKEQYNEALESADALLVIMGFDEESRLIESTSFKSKVVDYLRCGRPIIVWGPDYSTAVKHAIREDFAEVVTEPNPKEVVASLERLRMDESRRKLIVENGYSFYNGNLDSDKVFGAVLEQLKKVIACYP